MHHSFLHLDSILRQRLAQLSIKEGIVGIHQKDDPVFQGSPLSEDCAQVVLEHMLDVGTQIVVLDVAQLLFIILFIEDGNLKIVEGPLGH